VSAQEKKDWGMGEADKVLAQATTGTGYLERAIR
jgi:hypothetical protein